MPISRRAATVSLAAALCFGGILSAAPGCTTNKCVNNTCTVTFKDGARSTTLGALNDTRVEMMGVRGDQVMVRVGGAQGVATRGQTTRIGLFRVTPEIVSDTEVKLKVSR
ncbi:hypothetical protein [Actinomadura flavalba]|uniref:hypothetical protein n=1 Tax=Actinomadura flavalba TaxID=1120938 RepID=UPI00036DEB1B|nr:hypothetical protein [Actinomadura flavalba]